MNTDQLMPVLIALIGSAGLWGFMSLKAKQNHERAMQERSERGEFNDTLKAQVDRLAEKLDRLTEEKEELLRQMSDMKASLASAEATIKHLEEQLRHRS